MNRPVFGGFMLNNIKGLVFNLALVMAVGLFSACDKSSHNQHTADSGTHEHAHAQLEGSVKVDGSSTVFPITEAMAEEFGKENPKVRVTVGLSGTGGGMKKFIEGVIDITGASRAIKASEIKMAEEKNRKFVELPVAYDGIAVVVSHKNTFAKDLTVAELKSIWEPESKIKLWSDVRKDWPKQAIKLYGPGVDSGTFDYFTNSIVGKSGATRPDFTASEDDNVLVQGVVSDEYALGYFGFAYWMENEDKLNRVAIDNGSGPILPSVETIEDASYAPLSRPVFIYISEASFAKQPVDAFVKFYIQHAKELVPQVGYVAFKEEVYAAVLQRWENKVLGSSFAGQSGKSILELVQAQGK
ncbi:MAG TPA: PstS family phosphate ABC transporter substrate-binding protein [Oligoflexia bacterium]|nr:PstS family phosphate ABC transporter substrate-binding protein [Oligoflexia bacterium]